MQGKVLGKAGEEFAANWLLARGFKVVEKNYHGPNGEVDIIAFESKEKYYLMVEVKTRSHRSGIGAINNQKLRRMNRAAEHYFFYHLNQPYVPDYELWGLCIWANGPEHLEVVDWVAL